MSNIFYKVKTSSSYPVNLLSRNGIEVKSIEFCGGNCTFSVDRRDGERAEKLLVNFQTEREYESGTGYTLRKLLGRTGIIVAAAAVCLVIILYSFCTFQIEIKGNTFVTDEAILERINEYATVPSFAKETDIRGMERRISALEGISSASVKKQGSKLIIEVLEEYPPLNPKDILIKNVPIVSAYDAIITRVVVRNGTATVKVNDSVRKGVELIIPYIILDENTKVASKASGEVYGRVWISESHVFYPQTMTFERTGRTQVITEVRGFEGINAKKCTFKNYEKEEKVYYTGTGVFPLKITETTYYETEEVSVPFDFEKNKEALIAEYTRKLEAELPEGCEKLKTWYSVKRVDKATELIIYYEIEINLVA